MGFALANCDWLGRTIAFYQVFFPTGEGGFGQMMYRSQKGDFRTPGMDFVHLLIFLAAR